MNPPMDIETFKTYQFKTDYIELEDLYDFNNKQLTKNMMKINFVVTHKNCLDGCMSSLIVKKYLQSQNIDLKEVIFFDACYGMDFSLLPDMMFGKYVLVCDFSFDKPLFNKMIGATGGNILVLDHHKTAQKNLQDEPNIDFEKRIKLKPYVLFDMNHSGAFLTWVYLFGFNDVPKAVLYVEDNDIWTKKLPLTRQFTTSMYDMNFDHDLYEKLFNDNYLITDVFPKGDGMMLQIDKDLNYLMQSCIPRFIKTSDNRYYFIACVNSVLHKSELGNNVVKSFKHSNMSMIYSHDMSSNSTYISFRSIEEKSDTTEVAKFLGGGGHRNASGANSNYKIDLPPGTCIADHNMYYVLDNLYEIHVVNPLNSNNQKTFIVLNSPMYKKHMASYLMQERYINDDGLIKNKSRTVNNQPGYQEGMFCMRNIMNDKTYDKKYDGACIWHYNGLTHKYELIIKTLPGDITGDNFPKYESCLKHTADTIIKTTNIPDMIEIESSMSIEVMLNTLNSIYFYK